MCHLKYSLIILTIQKCWVTLYSWVCHLKYSLHFIALEDMSKNSIIIKSDMSSVFLCNSDLLTYKDHGIFISIMCADYCGPVLIGSRNKLSHNNLEQSRHNALLGLRAFIKLSSENKKTRRSNNIVERKLETILSSRCSHVHCLHSLLTSRTLY